MEANFSFTAMEKGDEKEISQLVQRVFEKFVAPDYTTEGFTTFMQFINPATIYSRNFRGNSYTLVCRAGDRIVGILEVQGWKHILLLFVDGDFHGRGIAKEMMRRVLELCRDKGETDTITVNASPYGEPIYRRLGFIPVSPQTVKDGIKFTPMQFTL